MGGDDVCRAGGLGLKQGGLEAAIALRPQSRNANRAYVMHISDNGAEANDRFGKIACAPLSAKKSAALV